ncbi:hypothetical protein F5Y12DRAFT_782761 [Xylaria sp. FL1777]|nr:hypothetical protein F5Y12DRAFT_782761 [Xylaria sp. FL1777]
MAQSQPQETLHVPLTSLEPLHTLNAYRAALGLGPSKNLISSTTGTLEIPQENSLAYQGNTALRRNICAPIPNELNCRLWITGLPATCTVNQLLGCIRGIGPIYACHITKPNSTGAKVWETAAASLTFFTAEAANRFLEQDALHPFTVADHRTKIVRHRIRTESVNVNGRSRVLRIVGDPRIVHPDYLARVFTHDWTVRFDTDYVQFTPDADGGAANEIIWAFGSFRAQAHTICMNINKAFVGRAQAIYVADPCVLESC